MNIKQIAKTCGGPDGAIYGDMIFEWKDYSEKAGFVYTGAHPDGDAWYYEYRN